MRVNSIASFVFEFWKAEPRILTLLTEVVRPMYALSVLFALLLVAAVPTAALAASPVAVLKSLRNITAYQDQHLGVFDDDWQQLIRTLGAANIRYEEVSDPEIALGQQRIGNYKLIIVPELVDVPLPVVSALDTYQKNGGRILIMDAGGAPGAGAQQLEQLAGVAVVKQTTTTDKRKIVMLKGTNPVHDEFSIATVCADFTLLPSAYA